MAEDPSSPQGEPQKKPLDDLVGEVSDLRLRLSRVEEAVRRMELAFVPPPYIPPPQELVPLASVAPEPPPLAPEVAPVAPEVPKKAVKRPSASLEQVVGTMWLSIAGVALLLLGGVFFYRYAVQEGWILPLHRCLIGTVMGFVMYGLGEWSVRRKMRPFSVAMFSVGVVWHYYTVWTAGPTGWFNLIPREIAFALMCAVTVTGMALSIRSRIRTTAFIAMVGAFATPVLLSSGRNQQVELMSYLLLIDVGFLLVAWWKRWRSLAPLAMVGTVLLFSLWFSRHYDPAALARTCAFAWSMAGVFVAYGLAEAIWRPGGEPVGMGATCISAALMAWMLLAMDPPAGVFYPQLLMLVVLVLSLAFWHGWPRLAAPALVVTAVLVAVWLGRRAGDEALTATNVWGWLLCGAYLLYVVAALKWKRTPEAQGVVIVGVAGVLMAWLLTVVDLSAGAFVGQLLALQVVLLAVCLWRRWRILPLLVLGVVAFFFVKWYRMSFQAAGGMTMNVLTWAMWAVFVAYSVLASIRSKSADAIAEAITALAGSLMAVVLIRLDLSETPFMAQLWVLNTAVLAVCLWRRWRVARVGVLIWSAQALLLQWLGVPETAEGVRTWAQTLLLPAPPDAATAWRWVAWLWALFIPVTADVWIRTFWRRRQWWPRWQEAGPPDPRRVAVREKLDAALSAVATALLFFTTWQLLKGWHHDWMGGYAAVLGVGSILGGWALLRRSDRRILAMAYFGQGLVLLVLATPIHFDKSSTTIAWAVQGVVAMLLAKRVRHPMLVIKAHAVLALALLGYLTVDLPSDPWLAGTLCAPLGVTVTNALAVGAGLSAAMLAAAATLRTGRTLISARADTIQAGWLTGVATLLYFVVTAALLPPLAATWWWLALSIGLAGVGVWRRSRWLTTTAVVTLTVIAAKLVAVDTLNRWAAAGSDTAWATVWNWQFGACVLLSAVLLAHAAALVRRRVQVGWFGEDGLAETTKHTIAAETLTAVLLIVWAGSFEVDRYFAATRSAWSDPTLAQHMALSLWWALYAAVVLTIGFARRRAMLRYTAIGLLALTLLKVFLVDMKGVEAVYRILSFLGVGALLLSASWLYHRHGRGPAANTPDTPTSDVGSI